MPSYFPFLLQQHFRRHEYQNANKRKEPQIDQTLEVKQTDKEQKTDNNQPTTRETKMVSTVDVETYLLLI
jgi:hypothetical protein